MVVLPGGGTTHLKVDLHQAPARVLYGLECWRRFVHTLCAASKVLRCGADESADRSNSSTDLEDSAAILMADLGDRKDLATAEDTTPATSDEVGYNSILCHR